MDYFADFSAPRPHTFAVSGKAHATKGAAAREAKTQPGGSVQPRDGRFYAMYPVLRSQANTVNSPDVALLACGALVELPAGYQTAHNPGYHVQNALAAYPDTLFHMYPKLLGIKTLYYAAAAYPSANHPAVVAAAETVRQGEAARRARIGSGGYLATMLAAPTLASLRH